LPEAVRSANQCDPVAQLSIRAWNMLGGLDWKGVEVVAEILGIDDIETLITHLCVIRDRQSQ